MFLSRMVDEQVLRREFCPARFAEVNALQSVQRALMTPEVRLWI